MKPNQINPELGDIRGRLLTRWQIGGHSAWFTPRNIEATFEQFYSDLQLGVAH